ncbi:MAG TPA: pyridine nucleotide-disulfide oxidoreductase, partial [Lachnospiraceae bacterium]|nr:pyridine nucleotide-disulfide oxidoreductase [Lachnospiraceae bacterium]
VLQGNLIVGRKAMKKALPAEMIQIPVKGEALNTTEDLTVRVQEGVQ